MLHQSAATTDMVFIFIIVGYLIWNAIAYFILQALHKYFCDNDTKHPYLSILCFGLMILVGLSALVATITCLIGDNYD